MDYRCSFQCFWQSFLDFSLGATFFDAISFFVCVFIMYQKWVKLFFFVSLKLLFGLCVGKIIGNFVCMTKNRSFSYDAVFYPSLMRNITFTKLTWIVLSIPPSHSVSLILSTASRSLSLHAHLDFHFFSRK